VCRCGGVTRWKGCVFSQNRVRDAPRKGVRRVLNGRTVARGAQPSEKRSLPTAFPAPRAAPVLVSDSSKAHELLGWTPRYPELDQQIAHAWTVSRRDAESLNERRNDHRRITPERVSAATWPSWRCSPRGSPVRRSWKPFCHGPNAEGIRDIPRLGGLSYSYLKRRLEQWGEGYHAAAPPPMPRIAGKLPPNEILREHGSRSAMQHKARCAIEAPGSADGVRRLAGGMARAYRWGRHNR
jgi:hypothetical protein